MFEIRVIGFALSLFCGIAQAEVLFDGRLSNHNFSAYQTLEADGRVLAGALAPNGIQARLERVSDPAGSGKFVMRATHVHGDLTTNGGYRSEAGTFKDPLGSERWYSWGYYLPEVFQTVQNDVAIAQIHDTPDTNESNMRNPSLSIVVQGDRVKLINAFDYDKITAPFGTQSIAEVDYQRRELASWQLDTNKWTFLDLHVKWAGDNTGFLEFWKDGDLLFKERNHINTFNDERGVWFKSGLYDWSSHPESITAYSTGVVIGNGQETLQSISMSLVPEPSLYIMMMIGLLVIMFYISIKTHDERRIRSCESR